MLLYCLVQVALRTKTTIYSVYWVHRVSMTIHSCINMSYNSTLFSGGQMSYYVIHVLGTVIVRCEVRLATGDGSGSGNSPSFLETDMGFIRLHNYG